MNNQHITDILERYGEIFFSNNTKSNADAQHHRCVMLFPSSFLRLISLTGYGKDNNSALIDLHHHLYSELKMVVKKIEEENQ